MDWLYEHKLPIGDYAKWVVDWLTNNGALFFDTLSIAIEKQIDNVLWLLQAPPPVVFVAIVSLLAFIVRRSIRFTIFVALSLLLIINLGYWQETTQTLALILSATFVCMLIGVPTGIFCAHHPRFYAWVQPLLDLMQTIPTFVYLIPTLILFGLGVVPGLISTVVFALPASIRLTQLGIASTPKQLLEAGEAFGATYWQRLWKIELPYARPNIMAGLTQTIMLSLSMVVISALVGADGLGVPTLRALNTVNIAKGFEVGISIVLIAIILDRFFRRPQRKSGQ
ncbi:choline ABC transporter permease subunit [Polycladidibacter stylochi]|uniref:choline ABC transporter permease subunit n=1 Tax=Polycladidibacter stylochi TaxID=1807766 RepID=UPI0008298C46|nr:choline ABC transporter permease subunit [Pseudovibrio stylochi]